MTDYINKGMGWKPSSLDHRDAIYKLSPNTAITLPSHVDLSTNISWLYDQGQTDCCAAESNRSLIRYVRKTQGLPDIDPSVAFLYWNAKALDNPPDTTRDNGTTIRNVLQGASSNGYCTEAMWSFSPQTLVTQPAVACFNIAKRNLVTLYSAIDQDDGDIKRCLASGYPFVFGITVTRSMMTTEVAQTGIVPMPGVDDASIGGHAILGVGYDDMSSQYKFLNSWGDWGDHGYGYLPYEYVESPYMASDFWTIGHTI